MNKFWDWMEQKGYGVFSRGEILIFDADFIAVNPTMQMMLGYFIQYLRAGEGKTDFVEVYNEWKSKIDG